MKKVKFIGALMAAVLAAAPVTGFAGNILSFNDNAIVAYAAPYNSAPKFILTDTKTGSPKLITGTRALLQNGGWYLVADSRGEFFCHNINTGEKKYFKTPREDGTKIDFHCPYNKYSIYPRTNNTKIMDTTSNGEAYMHYTIYFQADGNLTGYSHENLSLPLFHSNSYVGSPKAEKYKSANKKLQQYIKKVNDYPNAFKLSISNYNYELTEKGDLVISALYVCKRLNKKYGEVWCTVWDSRYDTIDRIV